MAKMLMMVDSPRSTRDEKLARVKSFSVRDVGGLVPRCAVWTCVGVRDRDRDGEDGARSEVGEVSERNVSRRG